MIEIPYRECKDCDGAICCKHMIIEEGTGVPFPPDDCIKKEEIEKEIKEHYERNS